MFAERRGRRSLQYLIDKLELFRDQGWMRGLHKTEFAKNSFCINIRVILQTLCFVLIVYITPKDGKNRKCEKV